MTAVSTPYDTLLVSQRGPAGHITLNRAEKRNALSLELMRELIDSLQLLSADREVRVIVIEGAGVAFSAGHDLGEMIGREPSFYRRLFDVCTELMEAIHRV
ncbi:MAG TPA: enoyl-CoA hydratase-related protein, partial [Gaiellaceae bacterium]|nr:enoyl-CoA hydratase-related protein [Gaiellaceae bacterium]